LQHNFLLHEVYISKVDRSVEEVVKISGGGLGSMDSILLAIGKIAEKSIASVSIDCR
jgi:hypothetical protein